MADATFDIVSKVDQLEADHALHQAQKEVAQRYDFKNVGASIEQSGEKVLIKANSEERAKAILEVYEAKLIKRDIPQEEPPRPQRRARSERRPNDSERTFTAPPPVRKSSDPWFDKPYEPDVTVPPTVRHSPRPNKTKREIPALLGGLRRQD